MFVFLYICSTNMDGSTWFLCHSSVVACILFSYQALGNSEECTKEANEPAPCFKDSAFDPFDGYVPSLVN